ncbi:uncharacterized protein F4822DRAFT_431118 [Hypoxylon trugodes]|uniref:uncharacterized protein n=1 Tax=Hypoxylon trugodes TaxID=326681 RepID=UPI0021A168C5|nr:uncharacterized protein F4822DRAFT_431118 [Hypoxylon trugodes]KAI1386245.1 hypothetical protein F4822DRAFT_431118 [Hypoxylon trugodes]
MPSADPHHDNIPRMPHEFHGIGTQFTDGTPFEENDASPSRSWTFPSDEAASRGVNPFILGASHYSPLCQSDSSNIPGHTPNERGNQTTRTNELYPQPNQLELIRPTPTDGCPGIEATPHYSSTAENTSQLPISQHISIIPIRHLLQNVIALGANLYSSLDGKMTIRFIVASFNYSLGIATGYSIYGAPTRANGVLPSPHDDTYAIMIAQISASLLSPLLFGFMSAKDRSVPFRQRVVSPYYLLLEFSVVLSLVSLFLYPLWPSGYRVTNAMTAVSLFFAIVGSWLSLEKGWKEATEMLQADEEIESGNN